MGPVGGASIGDKRKGNVSEMLYLDIRSPEPLGPYCYTYMYIFEMPYFKPLYAHTTRMQQPQKRALTIPPVAVAPPPTQSLVEYDDEGSCIICYEDMDEKDSCKLSCGHRFHTDVSIAVRFVSAEIFTPCLPPSLLPSLPPSLPPSLQCIRSWFKEQNTCPTCRNYALLPDDYPFLH